MEPITRPLTVHVREVLSSSIAVGHYFVLSTCTVRMSVCRYRERGVRASETLRLATYLSVPSPTCTFKFTRYVDLLHFHHGVGSAGFSWHQSFVMRATKSTIT